jgi:hypothetical protein
MLGAGLLGGAIGLATLTRPETILLVPFLAVPLFVLLRELPWSRRLGLLAVTAAVTGLLLAPWIVRNTTGFERPVLFSTNADTVLGVSNCDQTYYGDELLGWWSTECSRRRSLLEDPSIHAGILRERAVEYAGDHPGRLASVVVWVRIARMWDVWRPFQNARLMIPEGRPYDASRLGVVAYWMLVPFAIGGAVVLHRRRDQPLWPLLVPPVIAMAVAVYSYGNPRFRAIVEPVIVVLAALGLDALRRAFVESRARPTATP